MMTIVLDDYRRPPRQFQWHVGEPLPPIDNERTVTIEADGHELRWLQLALDVGKVEANKDYYKRVWGVDHE